MGNVIKNDETLMFDPTKSYKTPNLFIPEQVKTPNTQKWFLKKKKKIH